MKEKTARGYINRRIKFLIQVKLKIKSICPSQLKYVKKCFKTLGLPSYL